jgi:hypothetical protein
VDLYQFSDWLSSTSLSQAIQLNLGVIPAIQTVHILALSLLFAAALILALRFAGRGLAAEPLHLLAARFTRLIWLMLVMLADFGVKEGEYDYRDIRDDRVNTFFSLKQGESKSFVLILNAAYKGEFFQPSIWCGAMYLDNCYSRHPGTPVKVTGDN